MSDADALASGRARPTSIAPGRRRGGGVRAAAASTQVAPPRSRLLLATTGRVVVTGLGKSGLVGAKIAATLASTGTPALFVHAADALHGDAGMVGDRRHRSLAISKSGDHRRGRALRRHGRSAAASRSSR